MADTFSNDLRLRLQESGSNAGTWGDLLNGTITNIASGFGQGSEAIPNASTHTITLADGTADEARSLYLKCTGGGQACTVTLGPNTISKVWIIDNATSYTLTFSQGSGANVAIAAGAVKVIATDGAGSGAAVVDTLDGLEGSMSTLAVTGALTVDTNTLVVDATNNRVGVGGTPATQLFVKSTANDANVFAIESADASQRLQFGVNTSNGGSYIFEQKAQALRFGTSDTERMRIDGATGNLLVGSSVATGARLSVIDSSVASKQIVFSNNASYYGSIGHDAGTGYNEYRTEAGGIHAFFRGTSTTADALIDSAGKINIGGVGNISPYGIRFAINGTGSGGAGLYFGSGAIIPTDNTPTITDANVDLGASNYRFKDGYFSGDVNATNFTGVGDGNTFIGMSGSDIMRFSTGGVERTRLTSSGAFLVGTTNDDVDSDDGVRIDPDGAMYSSLGTGNAGYYIRSGGAWNFYVLATGQIYSKFNSIQLISDERLKENVRDCEGLEKVLQLQPRKFDWKAGHGKDIADDRGFIAQELEQVFPELIGEFKEPLDDDAITYKTVSQDLIPVMVKAIQELKEELNTATARITELENN